MALFDIPTRTNSKANDKKLVEKAKIVNKATPTIKGGSSLLDRINSIRDLVAKNLGKYKENSILIQDEKTLRDYLTKAIDNGVISIDTETTGLDPLLDQIAGICIYTPNMPGAYIPINHISYITNMVVPNQLDKNIIRTEFEKLLDTKPEIIMFNAVFDIRVLRHGIGLHNIYCTWDCYVAQRLLNENEGDGANNLKMLHRKYVLNGQEDAFRFDDLFKGIPFTMIPLQTAYLYACHDPVITYELYEYQKKYLCSDREDMKALYWSFINIEMPVLDAVANMEDNGVTFDFDYNEKLKDKYHKILDEREAEFHKLCKKYQKQIDEWRNKTNKLDNPINIKSSDQLCILLYDILELPMFYNKQKRKEVRTTANDYLETLDHPIVKAIQSYREFATIVSTFIDKMPNCVNPNDGRVHCKFNSYGADTGRFTSKDPNLQNIPSHNKDIRKMFIASPGYVLMSSDYSQQEPRSLAALCRMNGDSQMYDTFMQGKDLYSEIASKAFNKPYEDCLEFYLDENGNKTDETNEEGKARRTQAKSILLGALYGRGVNSIAEQLGCTPEKAQQIKDSVFRGFPAIKKFEKDSLQMARDIGYVTTIAGRKRRLPALQLDEYEFKWKNGFAPDNDLLDFDDDLEQEIPERTIRKYLTRLHNCRFNEKQKIFKQANEEGIWIIDNGAKIAEATRQCVNARIQGSASDLTKLALIGLNSNKRLKELGFRLLIPVHDEVIAECPEENMLECSKLLSDIMCESASKLLEMPISCDVEITRAWYGEKLDGTEIKQKETQTSHAMDKELRNGY